MPANTAPIYIRKPNVRIAGDLIGSAANTATDGTGVNITQIFEASNPEGSYVYSVRLKCVGTIASTIARLFLCTNVNTFTPGVSNIVSTTSLIAEINISAFTASNLLPSPVYEIPVNMAINPGFKLLMTFGTSTGASTTGFNPTTIAGDF